MERGDVDRGARGQLRRRAAKTGRREAVGGLAAAVAGVGLIAVLEHGPAVAIVPTVAQPSATAAITAAMPTTTSTVAPTSSATALAAVSASTPLAITGARQAAATAAASYASSHGWTTGIAIVDLQTGATTTAGDPNALFPAESTVKVLLAARILTDGEMTGDVAAAAHEMIVASDDASADVLYDMGGGDGAVAWTESHYGIPGLGDGPANGAGEWGSTQVTALGMARFLAAADDDPVAGPWLNSTMAQMQPTAADGTNQLFGIAAAAPGSAVKQGWGGDVPGMNAETTPSIGYVDGRYAIAIYTLHTPTVSQSASAAIVTTQAQLLLPGGHVPDL
ncbi:MAG: hypothetical protein ABI746_06810 [Dermatophilaceae bacterium]